MTTTTVGDDVQAYLRRVRERLADLPAEEREDLLADVEPSVLDSAGESDAPVALRLGPPERFADELRAAAGLPPRADAAPRRTTLRERLRSLAADPRLRAVAPLWWIAAGFLAVAWVDRDGGRPLALAGAAVLVAAAFTTVGRRPSWWVTAALALVLLADLASVASRAPTTVEVAPVVPETGLVYDGLPLDNLFAFDRRGRLLQDVRLYAENGRPIDVDRGARDPDRRVPRARGGERAFNAFPVRYFEPGTRRVARPGAGAPPAPAPLVTPRVR
jgi:hypothetical protein